MHLSFFTSESLFTYEQNQPLKIDLKVLAWQEKIPKYLYTPKSDCAVNQVFLVENCKFLTLKSIRIDLLLDPASLKWPNKKLQSPFALFSALVIGVWSGTIHILYSMN